MSRKNGAKMLSGRGKNWSKIVHIRKRNPHCHGWRPDVHTKAGVSVKNQRVLIQFEIFRMSEEVRVHISIQTREFLSSSVLTVQ